MVTFSTAPAFTPPDRGFTLVELLVAAAVTIVAVSLAMTLVAPTGVAFQALPEAVDTQQRLRIAAQAIADDITGAGVGPSLGWGAAATPTWPAVLPCRWTGEPLTTVPGGCAGSDTITLLTMTTAAPQGMISQSAGPNGILHIESPSACATSRSACRLHADAHALLIDGTGRWDIFLITGVSADGSEVAHARDPLSRTAGEGALVGEVLLNSYSVRPDPATGVMQLRRGTGGPQDYPVADHVTSLSFEYFADAAPPSLVSGGSPGVRATTYGPLPPPVDIDDPADAWPPGENCTFAVADGRQVPRLARLEPDARGLAPLPVSALSDGPWCPDAESPNRWDADLLRVRLVRVALRVQPQSPAVRGPTEAPDRTRFPLEVTRWVPSLEVRLDAALRSRSR